MKMDLSLDLRKAPAHHHEEENVQGGQSSRWRG